MKCLGTIAACLAGWLAMGANLPADDLAVASNAPPANPYAEISVRNVFGLVPPPPPRDPKEDEQKNLPKITLTGIQNVFGNLQVLFKVAPKPGTQGKDQYYTLNQGERQDDIEVVKVDDVNNVVTFDNHGITQDVPLVEAKGSGGSGGPAGPAGTNPGRPPGFPGGRGGPGGPVGGIIPFGGQPGGHITTADGNPGFNNGSAPGGANPTTPVNSLQSHIYQPPPSHMSRDATVIAIEAKRAELMNEPNPPYSPNLLPTTPLTQFNTPGGSGNTGN